MAIISQPRPDAGGWSCKPGHSQRLPQSETQSRSDAKGWTCKPGHSQALNEDQMQKVNMQAKASLGATTIEDSVKTRRKLVDMQTVSGHFQGPPQSKTPSKPDTKDGQASQNIPKGHHHRRLKQDHMQRGGYANRLKVSQTTTTTDAHGFFHTCRPAWQAYPPAQTCNHFLAYQKNA